MTPNLNPTEANALRGMLSTHAGKIRAMGYGLSAEQVTELIEKLTPRNTIKHVSFRQVVCTPPERKISFTLK